MGQLQTTSGGTYGMDVDGPWSAPASEARLSSPWKRLGAHLLDQLLMVVTLGIGWIVWAAFTLADGQTPAKRVLAMRTVDVETGEPPDWGRMFVREVIAKPLASLVTLGLGFVWLLWDERIQNVYDKVMGTLVVDETPAG